MLDCTVFYTKPLQFLSKHKGVELAAVALFDLTKKAEKHTNAFKDAVTPLLGMNASQFTAPSQPAKQRRQ